MTAATLPSPTAGSGAPAGEAPARIPDALILVGNPNVGKSVIFGVLTGRYVTVSNYPGTTVEVTRGHADAGGRRIAITDTPGINTLIPQSEDERVTRDILLNETGTVLQVGDEKNLPRTLFLALQIAEAGRPLVLCLNMGDEAESRGIRVDVGALSRRLGVEVLRTVATRREGTSRILPLAGEARPSPHRLTYDPRIEEALAEMEPILPPAPIAPRSLALMILAGDSSLAPWLHARLDDAAVERLEEIRLRLERAVPRSLSWAINEHRLRAARALAAEVTVDRGARSSRLAGALGAATMHPVWGLPILLAVLYAIYLFVGAFGAGTAVDWLESGVFGKPMATLDLETGPGGRWQEVPAPPGRDRRIRLVGSAPGTVEIGIEERLGDGPGGGWAPLEEAPPRAYAVSAGGTAEAPAVSTGPGTYRVDADAAAERIEILSWSGWINPALHGFLMRWSPSPALTDLLAGPYGLVTMGLTYAIAIVLPIVATFFIAFSVLEDSGYLPRLAILVNRAFRLMGLNGKAVLPMILGLGCDTMATLTTRILETKKERLVVIFLLALGVPCSAQLGVILGMLAGLSWKAALVWTGVLAGTIVFAGWAAARVIPGRGSDFILEIPPLRRPALGNILTKTMARIEWYMKEAVPLFLLGTLLLFVADRSGALGALEAVFEPFVTGLLGLPPQASEAFIIGFLRRDFGSAGLYRLSEAGLLDPIQTVVSLVTVTLFIPCIANFLMIVKEKGTRIALLVAAVIFPFAIAVGAGLNFALRALGVTL